MTDHTRAREALARIADGMAYGFSYIGAATPSNMAAVIALVAEQDKRIAELEKDAQEVVLWQCIHADGKTGLTYDDWGNGSCAKDKRIAELEAAIQPFSDAASRWDEPDQNGPWPDIQDAEVVLGDLRAARTALEKK